MGSVDLDPWQAGDEACKSRPRRRLSAFGNLFLNLPEPDSHHFAVDAELSNSVPVLTWVACKPGPKMEPALETGGKPMSRFTIAAIALACVGTLAGCASQPPPAPPMSANMSATEGTVTFSGGAIAVGIGFQWGSGTLTYQGQQYLFKLNGLTVVDVGVSRVTGTGTVRNLHNVADFSGNYVSASAGAAVAGGGSVTTLRNQNGVVIDGITTAQGVRLTLAPGGVSITLSGPS
jgi:hypothetical protein